MRRCAGYNRECITILARDNQDTLCSSCQARRADAIVGAHEAYAQRLSRGDSGHCKRGHEFTMQNTILRDGGLRRSCRECEMQASLRRRSRERAA